MSNTFYCYSVFKLVYKYVTIPKIRIIQDSRSYTIYIERKVINNIIAVTEVEQKYTASKPESTSLYQIYILSYVKEVVENR